MAACKRLLARQLAFWAEGDDLSKLDLVRWISEQVFRGGTMQGLTKSESDAWLLRVLDHLLMEREADLRVLVRKRHDLARLAITRLSDHGRRQVRAARTLIDGRSPRRLETSADAATVLEETGYTPYRKHSDLFDFRNHAFELVGEMGDEESRMRSELTTIPT